MCVSILFIWSAPVALFNVLIFYERDEKKSKFYSEKHQEVLYGNYSFQLYHSTLHLVGYFRPWVSWWKVVCWDQRAPLLTGNILVERRLHDPHLSTSACFPSYKGHSCSSWGGESSQDMGKGPEKPCSFPLLHLQGEPQGCNNMQTLYAKPFVWHCPPCIFSDVQLRLVPLDFFPLKALIKPPWLTNPPSFIKPVGTSFLKHLLTYQIKLKLSCGFKYMDCIP